MIEIVCVKLISVTRPSCAYLSVKIKGDNASLNCDSKGVWQKVEIQGGDEMFHGR